MEEKAAVANTLSLANVKPVMTALPYPPVRVKEKNKAYANLLSIDYCGSVSELSAITQYINNENRLSCEKSPLVQTILGIAMAEMIHLQKLGELIFLLGGDVDFVARYKNGETKLWTPNYLTIPGEVKRMLLADIEAEKSAISQYRMHMKLIKDEFINAVLERIIQDEQYHIMLLQAMMKEL